MLVFSRVYRSDDILLQIPALGEWQGLGVDPTQSITNNHPLLLQQ